MVQRCAPALIAYQRGFLNFTACEPSRDIIRREGDRERELARQGQHGLQRPRVRGLHRGRGITISEGFSSSLWRMLNQTAKASARRSGILHCTSWVHRNS